MTVENLYATNPIWTNFFNLNKVPRGSKKEKKVIAFIKAFGEGLGLETIVDQTGNVLIKKPATTGMENRSKVVLQGHLDMVHEKNANTMFNFDTQGIDMYVDGDWVKAQGTTLGADNGIGVAYIMTILASTDIPHPDIEALFTVDEETGLTGANAIASDWLTGAYFLNLDTEEDNSVCIGCAGGMDVIIRANYTPEKAAGEDYLAVQLKVSGLTGGHSGTEIHLYRANANKLMAMLLYKLSEAGINFQLVSLHGGSKRNAIPRECVAEIVIATADIENFGNIICQTESAFASIYATTDPELAISYEQRPNYDLGTCTVMPELQLQQLIIALLACKNGVVDINRDVHELLIQTSNNLGVVVVENGNCEITCLPRSFVTDELEMLAISLKCQFHSMTNWSNFSFTEEGGYPGWAPKPDNSITKIVVKCYTNLFGEKPKVAAIHAGLECGIIHEKYPQMEFISFGPTILGAHSPDERVSISSVEKSWTLLLEVLQNIPEA
ncbi:MAG: aminoacyl-histidine dipeptidase [Candidatus Peribacteria bacterium]|nr:MAG: aminoacyl-histidine dipeptidase [Candidatus Peribacteria bacterium]